MVDENVTKALLQLDDPDIILDLRSVNGKAKCNVFDLFWDELKLYLDETTLAVDERRHGEVMHMPFAISIRHLCDVITERLNKNTSTQHLPYLQ